jgi:hypothetical protein
MTVTKEQYEKALDVIHEHLPFQLQRQDKKTGEWKNVGTCVRGQAVAYAELNALKERIPKAVLRVLPKNEADKYREGILLGRKLGPENDDERPPRRPTMYMPDNL